MGLFDTLDYEVKCPHCGAVVDDIQTKALGCMLKVYKKGDNISDKLGRLKIEKGSISGYTHCSKCGKEVNAEIAIKDGRFADVMRVYLDEDDR